VFKNINFAALRFSWPDAAMVIILAAEGISYGTSLYRENSLFAFADTSFLVLFFYWIKLNLVSDSQRNKIYLFLAILGVLLSIDGILTFLSGYDQMKSAGLNDPADLRRIFYIGSPSGSPAGEWITIYLTLLPFPIIILLGNYKKEDSKSLLLSIPVMLMLLISVLSFSRGMYLAVASFAIAGSTLFLLYKLSTFKKVILFNSVFILSIGTIAVVSPLGKSVLTTVYMFQTASQVRSYEGRKNLWRESVRIIKEYPLSGIGGNNFPVQHAAYINQNDDAPFVGRVFNFFLQLTIEKGFLGLVAYCSLIIVFFYYSHRKLKLLHDNWIQQTAAVLFMSAFAAVMVRDMSYSSILSNKGAHLLLWFMVAHNTQMPNKTCLQQTKCYQRITALLPVCIALFVFLAIAIVLIKKEKAEEKLISFVDQLNEGKLSVAHQNIEAAIRMSPTNAYYWACKGVLAERVLRRNFDPEKFLANSMAFNEQESEQIRTSIEAYKKALELNPLDGQFYHNLGWLSLFNKEEQQANEYFQKAIQIDSKAAMYHISLGLLKEKEGKRDGALEEYCTALQQLPILLDAPFYSDLQKRMAAESKQIIINGIHSLEKELQLRNSPITAAKLARLYLAIGENQKSFLLLERVTKELPGLSRPWLYLGDIYQSCNKDSEMVQCYRRTVLLEKYDPAPLLRLVRFYARHNDTSDAIHYYRQLVKATTYQFSDHAMRVTRMYYSKCKDERCVVKDDLIPNGFMAYCSPNIDVSADYLRLMGLEAGDEQR
jgi:tetratricopeptide (TPR) repeat protein